MDYNNTVIIILVLGVICLWLYHRKPSPDQPRRPRSNRVIFLGIIFVMGMFYILKQAEMIPG